MQMKRVRVNDLSAPSVILVNNTFDEIVENVDDVDVANGDTLELTATLVHMIEIESRNEPVEVGIFIEMSVSADDFVREYDYDECEDYVRADHLRASDKYEIYEEEQYTEQELKEIKAYVEKYLVGSSSETTYYVEASFED